jgi:hypothetical protein
MSGPQGAPTDQAAVGRDEGETAFAEGEGAQANRCDLEALRDTRPCRKWTVSGAGGSTGQRRCQGQTLVELRASLAHGIRGADSWTAAA